MLAIICRCSSASASPRWSVPSGDRFVNPPVKALGNSLAKIYRAQRSGRSHAQLQRVEARRLRNDQVGSIPETEEFDRRDSGL